MKPLLRPILLAALTCVAVQGAVDPYEPDSNTLHLWHVDGATSAGDEVGSMGLAKQGTGGLFQSAALDSLTYSFDTLGTASLQSAAIDGASELMSSTTGAFSWELIFNANTAEDAGTGTQRLFSYGTDIQLKLNYLETGLFLAIYTSAEGTIFNTRIDSTYQTNTWHHVAITYDGNAATADNGTVYFSELGGADANATMLGNFTLANDLSLTAAKKLTVGSKLNAGGDLFDGSIDEIRVSDIARSADSFLQSPPAALIAPYSADIDTIHLWHLDSTTSPLPDSAGSLDLLNWEQNGTLAINSFYGLNKAYESSDTTNSALQTSTNIEWNAEMMGADGAFTWEMVIRPDEASNSGTGFQMLMQHNNAVADADQMQLKLNYGAAGYLFLSLYDSNEGTLFSQRVDSATLGNNQYTTNGWFHLAVTYDGSSTGKVYWTQLGDTYSGTANELLGFSLSSDLNFTNGTLAIGGNANLNGSVFNGAIDEVRISRIARNASSFLSGPAGTNASPYESWLSDFDVGTSTNMTDDPDTDGLSNLYEFGLGGDPSDVNDIGLVPTYETASGFFEYVHAQRSDAETLGLNYSMNWSDDLTGTPWTNGNYEVTGTNVTGGTFDYVTNRISTGTLPIQFLKLIIESD